jgi:hypothetical protein
VLFRSKNKHADKSNIQAQKLSTNSLFSSTFIKTFLLFLESLGVSKKLDDFVAYLYLVDKKYKNANLSYKINKIVFLINQIKNAFSALYFEIKTLRSEIDFLHSEHLEKRRGK